MIRSALALVFSAALSLALWVPALTVPAVASTQAPSAASTTLPLVA